MKMKVNNQSLERLFINLNILDGGISGKLPGVDDEEPVGAAVSSKDSKTTSQKNAEESEEGEEEEDEN